MPKTEVAIIGGGPAGLTAAYRLAREGVDVTVFEADPVHCGGISRTEQYKGYRFDIGGHRFFSKSTEIEKLWDEILPDGMLVRPRSSRIYYRGRLFSYPLNGPEALRKLGVIEAARCVASYVDARVRPKARIESFEDWVVDQFGRRLFEIFFKTYTEKVWGMPCSEISADWAAQRIKGMSLRVALEDSLVRMLGLDRGLAAKSLTQSFRYPRLGPGMMWDECAAKTIGLGGRVSMGQRVTQLAYHANPGRWTVHHRAVDGAEEVTEAEHVISSAPMRELVASLTPRAPVEVSRAAAALRYRDFMIAALIVDVEHVFTDNWIYIHDPSVKVGRIQNFKSWSPEMVPDPSKTCLGMEYFCFEGDGMWEAPDHEILALARNEIAKLKLVRPTQVSDGCVVRQRKAYPVYDADYTVHVETIRRGLADAYPTLHLVGRNGMHKYNNQDHSMMTALLTAENIIAGRTVYDVWRVNDDAEYHEGDASAPAGASGLRIVPSRRVDLPPTGARRG